MAKHKNELLQVCVAVSDWRKENGPNDEYIELARGYSLIDGHHRLEKAYRHGVKQLPAYILPMEHHVGFIFKGYREYANYWNGKLLSPFHIPCTGFLKSCAGSDPFVVWLTHLCGRQERIYPFPNTLGLSLYNIFKPIQDIFQITGKKCLSS
ncbi:ParB/RepB/Spo0J family partition protein [Pelotomaculum terephthalicicum JT]|uniref:ParB/RepB/Spo0J family partition protein n=1 Tax=Pelotomaculum TaxID=191373 RepID=UPI001F03F9F1|nr:MULTISPECIES: ParB/RepB/Spo0J family partition protein [Pelotomaculum]MCG9966587.1 ParB/RepB/Spo0J family partition protein [Pelotomaculum terephthalicicum JT]